jgi:hypothetical protein
MTKYQKLQARHFKARAKIVAEAQGHFDYHEHGGKRYVEMEEVLETDEETGEKRLVEQPKLLVPERKFKVLNLKDEEVTRQFIEALRASGIPISQRTRTRNLDIDFDEEMNISQDEAVDQIVAEQEVRKRAYSALRQAGLPIPEDLQADFAPVAQIGQGAPPGAQLQALPRLGIDSDSPSPNLAPVPGDEALGEEVTPGQEEEEEEATNTDQAQRPPESDQERAGMPKAGALFRRTAAAREYAAAHDPEKIEAISHYDKPVPPLQPGQQPPDPDWKSFDAPAHYKTPRHVGLRRQVAIKPGDEIDADLYPEDKAG